MPIPHGQKGPRNAGWPTTTFEAENFGDDDNIGVKCGSASRNRVDIDLDCMEAVKLAPHMLPPTGRIHGRPSKPSSHYWYECPDIKLEQFVDLDGSMILEIRSDGGQTVVPPSMHPDCERFEWNSHREIAPQDATELRRAAAVLATTVLISRNWPDGGSRHQVALAYAGFLANRDLTADHVAAIIENAAELAGDNECKDRARTAADTVKRKQAGHHVTGGPTLIEQVGASVVQRLQRWLGGEDEDAIDELNEKHFVTRLGSTLVVGIEGDTTTEFVTRQTFLHMYENRTVQRGKRRVELGQLWVKSPRRRQFTRAVFAPPPLTCDDSDYNLWRGFSVAPDNRPYPAQRCGCYLEHVHDVICGGIEAHSTYLLNLMAFKVQNPGTLTEVAVAMRSIPGAGKGVFTREYAKLFAPHDVHLTRSEHVTGRFNAQLSQKILVFADEAIWAEAKRDRGSLKGLITEPTLPVERKGIDTVTETNCIQLVTATNELQAAPKDFRDRRWWVLHVSSHRANQHDYFKRIIDEMNHGGREALLAVLQARDLSAFDPRNFPRTAAGDEQQDLMMPAWQQWWEECLVSGSIGEGTWVTWIPSRTLHTAYTDWCEAMKLRPSRMTMKGLVARLKPYLGDPQPSTRWVKHSFDEAKGKSVRGWTLPDLGRARSLFDGLTGRENSWPDLQPSVFPQEAA